MYIPLFFAYMVRNISRDLEDIKPASTVGSLVKGWAGVVVALEIVVGHERSLQLEDGLGQPLLSLR